MIKKTLILFLLIFIFISCTKDNKEDQKVSIKSDDVTIETNKKPESKVLKEPIETNEPKQLTELKNAIRSKNKDNESTESTEPKKFKITDLQSIKDENFREIKDKILYGIVINDNVNLYKIHKELEPLNEISKFEKVIIENDTEWIAFDDGYRKFYQLNIDGNKEIYIDTKDCSLILNEHNNLQIGIIENIQSFHEDAYGDPVEAKLYMIYNYLVTIENKQILVDDLNYSNQESFHSGSQVTHIETKELNNDENIEIIVRTIYSGFLLYGDGFRYAGEGWFNINENKLTRIFGHSIRGGGLLVNSSMKNGEIEFCNSNSDNFKNIIKLTKFESMSDDLDSKPDQKVIKFYEWNQEKYKSIEEYYPITGVVNIHDVRLRSESNLNSNVIGKLEENEKILVLDRSCSKIKINKMNSFWYQILRKDGTKGWMYGHFLDIDVRNEEISYSEKDFLKKE